MRIELWSYDEYGQGSIVASGTDLDKMLDEARKQVSTINLDNALTAAEKTKNWDAYFPVVIKGKGVSKDVIYAGNRRNGKHQAWVKDKKGSYALADLPRDATVRHILGEIPKGKGKDKTYDTWFLADHKGNLTEGASHPELQNKTQLFVKIIP